MKLLEILDSSAYCSIGTINTDRDLGILERFIMQNENLIKRFPYKIVAVNGEFAYKADLIWTAYFPDITVINTRRNLGHTFGTLDLDAAIFKEAKKNPKLKWIWKFSNDILIEESIFDKEVGLADFYYFNNVGYSSLVQWKFDIKQLVSDLYDGSTMYPQTNFYIIRSNVDELIDTDKLADMYEQWKNTPEKKPWELFKGIDCESVLLNCVARNKLITYQLLDKASLTKLCEHIQRTNLTDGSFKNIMFSDIGNFCHYQYVDENVLVI